MAGGLPPGSRGHVTDAGGLFWSTPGKIESRTARVTTMSGPSIRARSLRCRSTRRRAVPASAPAPSAVKRCESCGAPSDAAGVPTRQLANLCTACERAFHGVLDNSAEPQAPESDDHAAQLDALFKALESAPPVETPAPAPFPPIDADVAAPAPSSPFGSPSAFAFASPSPSPATSPASPFVDASGGAIAMPGLTASSSRVPFANITPAAEPRSALFASPRGQRRRAGRQ